MKWLVGVLSCAVVSSALAATAVPAHADVPGNDTVAGAIVLADNAATAEDTTGATLTDDEAALAAPYLSGTFSNAVWFSYTATSSWAKLTDLPSGTLTPAQDTSFVVKGPSGVVSWGSQPTWFATPGTTYQVIAYAIGSPGEITVVVDPSDPTPVASQSIGSVTTDATGQTSINASFVCTGYINGYSTFYLREVEGGPVVGAAFLSGLVTCDGQSHAASLPVSWVGSAQPSRVWISDGLQSCVSWGPGPQSAICTNANPVDGYYDVTGGTTPPTQAPSVSVDDARVSVGRDGRLTATVTYTCAGVVTYSSTWVGVKDLYHGRGGTDIATRGQDISPTCDGTRHQFTMLFDPAHKVSVKDRVDIYAGLYVQATASLHDDAYIDHAVTVTATPEPQARTRQKTRHHTRLKRWAKPRV